MLEAAWLIPAFPLAGFVLILLIGRRLGEAFSASSNGCTRIVEGTSEFGSGSLKFALGFASRLRSQSALLCPRA